VDTWIFIWFHSGITIREAAGEPVAGLTAEALKDIAAISQVDPAESDSETAERQLDDIIEYLRFAAINIGHRSTSATGG
jgi:uncharacterized protein YgfB (UPF0149 family)